MFPDDEDEEYLSVAEMDADSAAFLGCMAYSGNVRGDDGRESGYVQRMLDLDDAQVMGEIECAYLHTIELPF